MARRYVPSTRSTSGPAGKRRKASSPRFLDLMPLDMRDKVRDKVPDKVRDKLLDKQLSGKLSGGLSGGLSAHFTLPRFTLQTPPPARMLPSA